MTTQTTATISTADLLTVISAAAKQRTAMRNEMKEAQADGDLRKRNRLARSYHSLSDTLRRLVDVYVESL